MTIRAHVRIAIVTTAVHCLIGLGAIHSADAEIRRGHLDQTGCGTLCPACRHACKLDVRVVQEEKTCFKVESKVVCIPRVVFPWQKLSRRKPCRSCDGRGCSTCVNNGASTRSVCVLKKEKYECPACSYTWSVENKQRPGKDESAD